MNFQIHNIDQQADFDSVMKNLKGAPWIGFDTEFVGEKSYIPVLCLIQIVCDQDIYLIDTLSVRDLAAFCDILEDPKILKITHAGDNDYRLMYQLCQTVPQNTFDTQIAAGFVGYNYPAGFAKIVERELRISLAKSHTVADWESRPIDPAALEYAIEDVKYLPSLHHSLTQKLKRRNREAWAREENQKWENPEFYVFDPYKEVLANDLIHQLDFKDKLFLMRLYFWRRDRAAELDTPKENVLQSRHISTVVRAMRSGHTGHRSNRTLPESVWKKYHKEWKELRETPATDTESTWIKSLPRPAPDDPEKDWSMELLYHFVKKQCLENEISAALLLPRGEFNKIKDGEPYDPSILEGWRAELLGPQLAGWLGEQKYLRATWQSDGCLIHPE